MFNNANEKIIVLNDLGETKKFVIEQLKAIECIQYSTYICKLFAGTGAINSDIIQQLFHLQAKTGVTIPGIKDEELEKVANSNIYSLIMSLIDSFLVNVDIENIPDILKSLFVKVDSFDRNNSRYPLISFDLNAIFNSPMCIFSLIREILSFRLSFLFDQNDDQKKN